MTDPDAEFEYLAAISAKKRSFNSLEPGLKSDTENYCHQLSRLSLNILPPGKTAEECFAIWKPWSQRIRPEASQAYKALFKPISAALKDLEEMQRDLSTREPNSEAEKKRLEFHIRDTNADHRNLTVDKVKYEEEVECHYQNVLQDSASTLIKNQTDEVKEWFFENVLSGFSKDIQAPRKDTRPVVTVEHKKGFSLPSEIMSMVYSLSDLETCISLREANSEWYRVFQQIEPVLKRKLKQRNPWMEPGDMDLQTWQDCVLVFVARLKWPTTENLDTIKVTHKKEKRSTAVAVELSYDEKLPANFTGMQPFVSQKCAVACDHFHVFYDDYGLHYVRDLWTFESHDAGGGFAEDVREEGDTIVVKTMDMEITLPADIVPFGMPEVIVHPASIIVDCDNGEYLIMPRDKPHFKNGFFVEKQSTDLYEQNNVLVAQTRVKYYQSRYSFSDFENNRMIDFPTSTSAEPVAFYNGLTWWDTRKRSLIPAFVDLDTNKIYYCPSKILTGVSSLFFEQASKLRDCHHFAVACSDRVPGSEIVNLAAGTITTVAVPHDWKDDYDRVIPGFLNGKFQARIMRDETREKTRHDVLSENNARQGPFGY